MNPRSVDPATRKEELVREVLDRVADKWTLIVIDELDDGALRFSRLREKVGGVSQKMLTKTLRLLERDGLVTRHVHPVIPPHVEYQLTPLGKRLGAAVCGIWSWVDEHADDIERSRRAYDGVHKSRASGRTVTDSVEAISSQPGA
jgi:DNA-binding HxlR family transcriptional regulator